MHVCVTPSVTEHRDVPLTAWHASDKPREVNNGAFMQLHNGQISFATYNLIVFLFATDFYLGNR